MSPLGSSRIAAANRAGLWGTCFRLLLPLLALLAGGCAAPAAAPRTNHDALYRSAAGGGDYDVDPRTAALARRGPARFPAKAPEVEEPQPCQHDWEFLDRATHSYIDPDSGLPALCTPRFCPKCGLVIHECQGRRRR